MKKNSNPSPERKKKKEEIPPNTAVVLLSNEHMCSTLKISLNFWGDRVGTGVSTQGLHLKPLHQPYFLEQFDLPGAGFELGFSSFLPPQ
jgi:hypothetical protein